MTFVRQSLTYREVLANVEMADLDHVRKITITATMTSNLLHLDELNIACAGPAGLHVLCLEGSLDKAFLAIVRLDTADVLSV